MLTYSQKNAGAGSADGQPTRPEEVTPETPLDSLNLNWQERDLPESERTKHVHRLHPYLGKFIPQLVEIFLRKYFKPGQTVIDPFCGSGTTLVQANELGINSFGCDISEFNVLLCRVKTAKYNLKEARREVLDILERVRRLTGQSARGTPGEAGPVLKAAENRYLSEWYAPRALKELLTYRHLIKDYQHQDLMKVILSRSARSARLAAHHDLDFPRKPQAGPYWCYKHSRMCQPTAGAFKFLRRYSLDTMERIEEFSRLRTDAAVEVFHRDSRHADYPCAHGVITSPPYVGLIDYHEQHAYAYHLLGLNDRRDEEIGSASEGVSLEAKKKYQQNIADVFRRVSQSLVPGSRVIVVAADRAGLYGEIAQMAGFKVEGVVNRHVNRRTGRRASEFFESVFVWVKEQG